MSAQRPKPDAPRVKRREASAANSSFPFSPRVSGLLPNSFCNRMRNSEILNVTSATFDFCLAASMISPMTLPNRSAKYMLVLLSELSRQALLA